MLGLTDNQLRTVMDTACTLPVEKRPDHDSAGYAHADCVAAMLHGIAKRIRILNLADHWPDCPKGGEFPIGLRDLYLQRIAAMLVLRGRGHFNDTDVTDVAKLVLCGLVQTADSSAA
jgi:hypothetical protein